MKNILSFLFAMLMIFSITGTAGAVPQTVNFSDWSDAPANTGQVDLDTTAANQWFYTNYGLEFSNVYMYWDNRDTFDQIGVANDTDSMPDYNGGTGSFYFADTTDYVTVDWMTISSHDIYLDIYDSSDTLLDSFYQAGSGTISGTTTLNGTGIAYMTFHDDGGHVGISTLSYDYDGVTDGTNDDVNPVPEPATLVLLGAGLLGLVGASRKKIIK